MTADAPRPVQTPADPLEEAIAAVAATSKAERAAFDAYLATPKTGGVHCSRAYARWKATVIDQAAAYSAAIDAAQDFTDLDRINAAALLVETDR